MAAKKPIKSKKSFFQRHRKGIVIFILVLLLLFTAYKIKHAYDQRILVRNINQAGADLDVLADEIRQTGVFENVERTKFCYEAARKFKKGPTYCSQRINAEIRDVDETRGLEIADMLAAVIEENEAFKFELIKGDFYPYKQDRLTIRFDVQQDYNPYPIRRCEGSIFSRLVSGHNGTGGSYLELKVECFAGNFDEYIYPRN